MAAEDKRDMEKKGRKQDEESREISKRPRREIPGWRKKVKEAWRKRIGSGTKRVGRLARDIAAWQHVKESRRRL